MKQLPVLPPATYHEPCPWQPDATVADWLLPRVLELTYTARDLEPFARDLGHDGPPFVWNPERRLLLRAELDAAFFHLYGVPREDIGHIMDSFWIVRDKDQRAHGSYRTRERILDIHDRLAHAASTGQPYATVLDPPPAHPSCAHAPADPGAAADPRHHAPDEPLSLAEIATLPMVEHFPLAIRLAPDERIPGLPHVLECVPLDTDTGEPEPDQLVLVRHPRIRRGEHTVAAAVGRFREKTLRDADTGATTHHITLRGPTPPAELRLTAFERHAFRVTGAVQVASPGETIQ